MLRSRQSGARAFQSLTNLKFDTEYNDGVFGMTDVSGFTVRNVENTGCISMTFKNPARENKTASNF